LQSRIGRVLRYRTSCGRAGLDLPNLTRSAAPPTARRSNVPITPTRDRHYERSEKQFDLAWFPRRRGASPPHLRGRDRSYEAAGASRPIVEASKNRA
jgi:hypothetical protein